MTKRIKEKGIRTNGEHEKKPRVRVRVRVRVYPIRTGTGTHVKDSLLSFSTFLFMFSGYRCQYTFAGVCYELYFLLQILTRL